MRQAFNKTFVASWNHNIKKIILIIQTRGWYVKQWALFSSSSLLIKHKIIMDVKISVHSKNEEIKKVEQKKKREEGGKWGGEIKIM